MRIAITGAGGFLGRNILNILKNGDCEVYAFSSQENRLQSQYSDTENIHFINMAEEVPTGIDVLLNCAFPRNEDGEQMATGLDYIQNVFCQCVGKKVSTVINISSQSVYSQKRKDCADESTTLNLESKYAVGKYATELLLNTICHDINHANIRMASLIGKDFEQRIVNKFVRIALTDKKLSVMEGNQAYGYMDVRDAANAIVTMCEDYENAGQWSEVYNLGIKGTYSLTEIASEVQKQVEKESGNRIKLKISKQNAYINTALDSNLFYQAFDWFPKYSLEDTIREIILYYQKKEEGSKE